MQAVSWLNISGSGPWLQEGIQPSAIAHFLRPIPAVNEVLPHKNIAGQNRIGSEKFSRRRGGNSQKPQRERFTKFRSPQYFGAAIQPRLA
jgi:hypothetical protein